MAVSEYKITEEFEKTVARYTEAPYAVALDNCSNALFLCLMHEKVKGLTIKIPKHTYMSVPCEIIHAGAKVKFTNEKAEGAYRLKPTRIFDSALMFTADMYIPGTLMCLSFTGPYKNLKLGKGGMILTDDPEAYRWFKKARMSGRNEVPYSIDDFTMIGWNFYMLPEISARGLMLMRSFYKADGTKRHIPNAVVNYPDLSKFKVYTQ
jgi:dTDP-4-amino-4,6-dideoxygalactose transaminase